ncbi:peptide-methionine (S)-S-oxide reductase MsrA [Rhizobium sp. P32RR-XVIII]|uniref:peptide-methionine (S)-S-oxide reductase MsrA n=1 Tax=Rhizobium sp. P32RR-XVIII TaxID=2726738 RepID=UPI0014563363|nr:peptide-methionine (S)-S-oxide reductase MsrA [Rhizobium sp. P32RR-XVIII]NLS06720.1 peptide-methionine (S)-S-oxide reductase MsrA [Rhizobium sp. P32RR-XVIII]
MSSHQKMTRRFRAVPLGIAVLLTAGVCLRFAAVAAEEPHVIPAPVQDEKPGAGLETAVFAGGCFWGVQGVFQHVDGVVSATSGYAGGVKSSAQYETVSTGSTGHAESVQVVFDPAKVSYGHLLQIYFSVAHDPTQLNRQGPDTGTQYRSAIFPQSDDQTKVAKAYISQLDHARVYDAAIVTRIETGKSFYPAEAYHQNFLTNNPTYPYIVINDLPKIENLRQIFPKDYRSEPVLVAQDGK